MTSLHVINGIAVETNKIILDILSSDEETANDDNLFDVIYALQYAFTKLSKLDTEVTFKYAVLIYQILVASELANVQYPLKWEIFEFGGYVINQDFFWLHVKRYLLLQNKSRFQDGEIIHDIPTNIACKLEKYNKLHNC